MSRPDTQPAAPVGGENAAPQNGGSTPPGGGLGLQATEQEVQTLARVIYEAASEATLARMWPDGARAVLASEWLAERDERMRREGAAEIVAKVEDVIGRASFGALIEGRRTAYHDGAYAVCPVLDLRAAISDALDDAERRGGSDRMVAATVRHVRAALTEETP